MTFTTPGIICFDLLLTSASKRQHQDLITFIQHQTFVPDFPIYADHNPTETNWQLHPLKQILDCTSLAELEFRFSVPQSRSYIAGTSHLYFNSATPLLTLDKNHKARLPQQITKAADLWRNFRIN
jgi:hypothetical protein